MEEVYKLLYKRNCSGLHIKSDSSSSMILVQIISEGKNNIYGTVYLLHYKEVDYILFFFNWKKFPSKESHVKIQCIIKKNFSPQSTDHPFPVERRGYCFLSQQQVTH